MEKQEQYSRRNCLLLLGNLEKKQENTDKLCLQAINEPLDLAISYKDIDRTHHKENPRNVDRKPRNIIIKLVRCNHRKKIFDSKKKLKGKKIAVTESLKVKGRERYIFKNVCTSEENVLYKDGSRKIMVYYS